MTALLPITQMLGWLKHTPAPHFWYGGGEAPSAPRFLRLSLWYTSNNRDRQDCPLLKPYWVLFITEVRDIGRYLQGEEFSPDLKAGIIAASLKEVGIRLEEKECEKINCKTGASSLAQLIRREIWMPSEPPAEFGEVPNCFNNKWIRECDICQK